MINLEAQEEYLELRRSGVGAITAARKIGVGAAEMDRYALMVPEFGAKLEEALAEALERVENMAWQRAQEGNFKEMELVLQTQAASKWMKPDREMVLKLQQGEELTPEAIEELNKRLQMRANAIDVEEVSNGELTSPPPAAD